jgi:peptidyl-tRNA hydrolase, PTH1 family
VFLFVGLGNPGERYARTRHNLGFRVLDRLAGRAEMRKGDGPYNFGRIRIGGEDVLLAKPLTYMNRSGVAVSDLVLRYAVPLERMVVICDDIRLPFGKLRFRPGGSDGGHNGLASIIRFLGSEGFPRLRLGIGSPERDVVEFVLAPFDRDEEADVERLVEAGSEGLSFLVRNGAEKAMNPLNRQAVL